jgi:hypothetical protein
MKNIIITLLMILLVFSLCICACAKKESIETSAVAAPAEEPEMPVTEEDTKAEDSAQELSGFDSIDEWVPMFPEFESSIVWNAVPKDFIGGFGAHASPKADNKGFVNIREAPSVKAEVIAELHHDSEILWSLVTETYVKDEQLFVGDYQVKNDDYTWTAVTSYDPAGGNSMTGWVALEVVDMWGI